MASRPFWQSSPGRLEVGEKDRRPQPKQYARKQVGGRNKSGPALRLDRLYGAIPRVTTKPHIRDGSSSKSTSKHSASSSSSPSPSDDEHAGRQPTNLASSKGKEVHHHKAMDNHTRATSSGSALSPAHRPSHESAYVDLFIIAQVN